MAIFPPMNKIKYKHAVYFIHLHVPLENHIEQIECRSYTQFHGTFNCFQSTLYLLLWPTEKLLFGSLFKTIFPFEFCQDDRRVAMLLTAGNNSVAPEPSAIDPSPKWRPKSQKNQNKISKTYTSARKNTYTLVTPQSFSISGVKSPEKM